MVIKNKGANNIEVINEADETAGLKQ